MSVRYHLIHQLTDLAKQQHFSWAFTGPHLLILVRRSITEEGQKAEKISEREEKVTAMPGTRTPVLTMGE